MGTMSWPDWSWDGRSFLSPPPVTALSSSTSPPTTEDGVKLPREEVERRLQAAGLIIVSVERLPDGYGDQLKCASGEIINCYDTGSVVVGGENRERTNDALGIPTSQRARPAAQPAPAAKLNRTVFV